MALATIQLREPIRVRGETRRVLEVQREVTLGDLIALEEQGLVLFGDLRPDGQLRALRYLVQQLCGLLPSDVDGINWLRDYPTVRDAMLPFLRLPEDGEPPRSDSSGADSPLATSRG
jgi:hypothetical protein